YAQEMGMKKTIRNVEDASVEAGANPALEAGNGHTAGNGGSAPADLSVILGALQTMREGDFSVRLPGYWTGLHGKIADTFNEIVATNQQMSRELTRVGQAVGKEGKTSERARFHQSRGSWGEM